MRHLLIHYALHENKIGENKIFIKDVFDKLKNDEQNESK